MTDLQAINQKWLDIGLIKQKPDPYAWRRGGYSGGVIPGLDTMVDSDGNLLIDSNHDDLQDQDQA